MINSIGEKDKKRGTYMSDKNLDKELEKNENEINESQDKDADKKVTEQQSSDNNSQSEDNKEDEYEKICYVCRRPESKAGKMIDMPGGICVCADCLQKSFDSFQNMGMGMNVKISDEDLKNLLNMPGIHMMNPEDFKREIPNKQKLKKKKKSEESKPIFDINKIPAPHIIKEKLDVDFPKDEIGRLALQFINAKGEDVVISKDEQTLTRQMIALVQEELLKHGIKRTKKNSNFYDRLMIHLTYFIERLDQDDSDSKVSMKNLEEHIKKDYPEAYQIGEDIYEVIRQHLGGGLHPNEKVYLVIHIQRLL